MHIVMVIMQNIKLLWRKCIKVPHSPTISLQINILWCDVSRDWICLYTV